MLLVLSLTTILCFNFLDLSKGIDQNGISLKAFYADSTIEVVDEEAIQRKIDRAKQTITPIYQDPTKHNADILRNLNALLQNLEELSQKAGSTEKSSGLKHQTAFYSLVSAQDNVTDIYKTYFTSPLPAERWKGIEQAAQKTIASILNQGVTESDDQLKRADIIKNALKKSNPRTSDKPLLYLIVNTTLEPNLILDDVAMKLKQETLAQRIAEKPEIRIFAKSEKIVDKGQKVSTVQKAALEKMGKVFGQNTILSFLGIFFIVILFVSTLWRYLYHFKDQQFFKPRQSALIATLVIATTLTFHLQNQGAFGDMPLYALPLASTALIIAIFTHYQLAVMVTTLLVFLLSVTMHQQFQGLAILLFGSYAGIYVLSKRVNYNDRGQLMIAGFYVGLTNAVLLIVLSLLKSEFIGILPTNTDSGNILNWGMSSLTGILWTLGSGVLSGILTIGSLPFLEAVFGLITPFTLMELGNHDQPLLKRMQFEAPGTFHHSIMVSTLSEAAAEEIGANVLLTRVGCLYHDIGKMKRPLFFIENQAYFGVENPHDKLTPRLSKMVITAHPRDSIEMAKQHKLPDVLMPFMTEHHGTLTAGYFYNQACIEEGIENVNKTQFRYPGPKPGSKETAIVMLADACESSVRALKGPTAAQVEERVNKIFNQRIEDGQFDNCPITFEDIERIKQTFIRVLRGIQHNRIEYQQTMMRELGKKLPEPANGKPLENGKTSQTSDSGTSKETQFIGEDEDWSTQCC